MIKNADNLDSARWLFDLFMVVFDAAPEDERAGVYEFFIRLLDHAGYGYNKQQFHNYTEADE